MKNETNKLTFRLTGIRPTLMHNGLMADPTNPLVRAIKEIVRKGSKKMTDSDYEKRDRLEWEAGLYYDEKLGPVIPSDNIERCLQLGAQKSRIGKDFAAAVFCDSDFYPIEYDGPRGKDEMYEAKGKDGKPRFILRKGVAVQQSRLIRVRPMIPTGWVLEFTLEFDSSIINRGQIIKAATDAGAYIGLGDWRPKFGRFTVEVLEG